MSVAYCWGMRQSHILGAGDATPDSSGIVRVVGDQKFRAIAAGATFTCGVTLDGRALCWGIAQKGQLGNGAFFDAASTPQPVAGDHRFMTIVAGREHACALDANGAAWCWGDNTFGQLGDSTNTHASRPVRVAGGQTFRQIGAGAESNTTCAVNTHGGGFCWGANDHGALGDGTTQASNAPVQVRGLADIAAIWPGADVSCAMTTRNDVYCWGNNTFGQLGLGSAVRDTMIPAPSQKVRSAERFIQVSAGKERVCAVAWSGVAYCWGSARDNRLGTNSDDSCRGGVSCTRNPGAIRGDVRFTAVSLGHDRACGAGRHSSQPVFCWGQSFSDPAQTMADATLIPVRGTPPPTAVAAAAPARVAAPVPAPAASSVVSAGAPVAAASSSADTTTRSSISPAPPVSAPHDRLRDDTEYFRDTAIDQIADKLMTEGDTAVWGQLFHELQGAENRDRYLALAPLLHDAPRPASVSEHLATQTAESMARVVAQRPAMAVLMSLRIWMNAVCSGARAAKQTACTDARLELVDAAEKLNAGNIGGARAHLELLGDRATQANQDGVFTLLEMRLVTGNVTTLLAKL